MYEIRILGEILADTEMTWQGSGVTTFGDFQAQLDGATGENLLVRIDSLGGSVDGGLKMYTALRRYASENNAHITTRADGDVASIATAPFLAGDTRIGSAYIAPFMHFAWATVSGDHNDLRLAAAEVESRTNQIAELYAEVTNLSRDEALAYMAEDTYISPDDMVDIRFATEIEQVSHPVAKNRPIFNKHKRKRKMPNKNKNQNALERKFDELKSLAIKALGGTEAGTSNKVIQTVNGLELDFVDLDVDEKISVGAEVEGDNVDPNGVYLIDDGNRKITLVDGVVNQIDELEIRNSSGSEDAGDEEGEDDDPEVQAQLTAKDDEIKALKAQIKAQEKAQKALSDEMDSLKTILNNNIKTKNVFGKGEGKGKVSDAADKDPKDLTPAERKELRAQRRREAKAKQGSRK